jgi:adenosylhomocysteine nucleosidase
VTRVGILVAMAVECRSLTPGRVPMGGCLELDGGCLVGLSGAGPEAAGRCSAALVEAGATSLVSWGCAAALAAGLNPGDLILPDRIRCTDGTLLDTDRGWRQRLGSKLDGRMPVFSGLLAESDRIVARENEKRALFAATGAIALDMESAAAARAAQRFCIPFIAIRSIIDPVDVSIPPSIHNAFDENGALHVPKMLFHALLRPADFLGVIRLGRHFGAAMQTLRLAAAIGRDTHFAIA